MEISLDDGTMQGNYLDGLGFRTESNLILRIHWRFKHSYAKLNTIGHNKVCDQIFRRFFRKPEIGGKNQIKYISTTISMVLRVSWKGFHMPKY